MATRKCEKTKNNQNAAGLYRKERAGARKHNQSDSSIPTSRIITICNNTSQLSCQVLKQGSHKNVNGYYKGLTDPDSLWYTKLMHGKNIVLSIKGLGIKGSSVKGSSVKGLGIKGLGIKYEHVKYLAGPPTEGNEHPTEGNEHPTEGNEHPTEGNEHP